MVLEAVWMIKDLKSNIKKHTFAFLINLKMSKDPLHGKTLETIINELVQFYGWEHLSYKININCFKSNPSVNSSLKFLRKTPWARKQVEDLYVFTFAKI